MSRWVRNRSGLIIPNREAGFIQPGIGLMNKKQGGGGGDPYWNNVAALLHFEGTPGTATFTDQKANTWTAAGGAVINNNNVKFGSCSLDLHTTSSQYIHNTTLSIPANTDFTVEIWVNFAGLRGGAYQSIFCVSSTYGVFLQNNNLILYLAGNVLNANIAPTIGEWIHVAWSRVSAVQRLFCRGVLLGSYSSNSAYGGGFYIGSDNSSEFSEIYGDEFRYTNGIGRYTATFIPPTAAFPNGP